MRRILTALPASVALLALGALPAAAEEATRPAAGTRGSFGGALLALVFGALFAAVFVYLAYQEPLPDVDSAEPDETHDTDA